jgi:hypothetical protein
VSDDQWVKREASEVKRDVRRAMRRLDRHEQKIEEHDCDDENERDTSVDEEAVRKSDRPVLRLSGPFGIQLEMRSPTPVMVIALAVIAVASAVSLIVWLVWARK